jgi:hypothetical protein
VNPASLCATTGSAQQVARETNAETIQRRFIICTSVGQSILQPGEVIAQIVTCSGMISMIHPLATNPKLNEREGVQNVQRIELTSAGRSSDPG